MTNKKLPLAEQLQAELSEKAEASRTWASWIKNKWAQFETWVHSWFPGVKTRFLLYMGMIGEAAATLQSFITGLPTTKYISAEMLSGLSLVLFVLAFWFRGMGDRVDEYRKDI